MNWFVVRAGAAAGGDELVRAAVRGDVPAGGDAGAAVGRRVRPHRHGPDQPRLRRGRPRRRKAPSHLAALRHRL